MAICQSYYGGDLFFFLFKDQNLTTRNICALAFRKHADVKQHFSCQSSPQQEPGWWISISEGCYYYLELGRERRTRAVSAETDLVLRVWRHQGADDWARPSATWQVIWGEDSQGAGEGTGPGIRGLEHQSQPQRVAVQHLGLRFITKEMKAALG